MFGGKLGEIFAPAHIAQVLKGGEDFSFVAAADEGVAGGAGIEGNPKQDDGGGDGDADSPGEAAARAQQADEAGADPCQHQRPECRAHGNGDDCADNDQCDKTNSAGKRVGSWQPGDAQQRHADAQEKGEIGHDLVGHLKEVVVDSDSGSDGNGDPWWKISAHQQVDQHQREQAHDEHDDLDCGGPKRVLVTEDFFDSGQKIRQPRIDVVLALPAEAIAFPGDEIAGDIAVKSAVAADAPLAVVGGNEHEGD